MPTKPTQDRDLEGYSSSYTGLYGDYAYEKGVIYTSLDTSAGITYSFVHSTFSPYVSYPDQDSIFQAYLSGVLEELEFGATKIDSGYIDDHVFETVHHINGSHLFARMRLHLKGRHLLIQMTFVPKEEVHSYTTDRFFNSLDYTAVSGEGDLYVDKIGIDSSGHYE